MASTSAPDYMNKYVGVYVWVCMQCLRLCISVCCTWRSVNGIPHAHPKPIASTTFNSLQLHHQHVNSYTQSSYIITSTPCCCAAPRGWHVYTQITCVKTILQDCCPTMPWKSSGKPSMVPSWDSQKPFLECYDIYMKVAIPDPLGMASPCGMCCHLSIPVLPCCL